jgi:hypothetical protein
MEKHAFAFIKGTTPIKSYKKTAFYYESIFWNSKAQRSDALAVERETMSLFLIQLVSLLN